MVEMPIWMSYLIYIFGIMAFFLVLVFFHNHSIDKKVVDQKTGRQKILVDFRQADGLMPRKLIPIDDNGVTVTINEGRYHLSEVKKPNDLSKEVESSGRGKTGKEEDRIDEQRRIFPILRYAKYPQNKSYLGLGKQVTLRLEEFQEGNPEPIHPFYGKWINKAGKACDPDEEDAKFVLGRLMVTASEFRNITNQMHLTAAAQEMENLRAQAKTLLAAIANMPTRKLVMFLGLVSVGVSAITLLIVWGIRGALGG